MRKIVKKAVTILTAGVLAFGAVSLAACGEKFTPLKDAPAATAEVNSNGGFVVEKGDYVYFINGVETYTSDNTYGAPVKGALMRAKKSDIAKGENNAEMVIPSLMVASDFTSGLYILGDRVYYATPNSDRNMQGVVENSYLNFNSAKLDGSDVKTYFNLSSNSTVYRYTEVDGTVYLLYVENSNLHSYNTKTDTDTELAHSMGAYVLDSVDKTNPYVYYTMSVTAEIDVEDSTVARNYNQIYRVRADVTEAPYEYTYSQEYLDEHDGEAPYINLGTIVLDGVGSVFKDIPTQFSHEGKTNDGKLSDTPESALGFTYTLQAYTNGGIYFTRSDLATTSTVGEDGWLYYLPESALGTSWNSITGNKRGGSMEVVAQSTDNAGTAAIFYRDADGKHHYLYVSDGAILRADVGENGLAEVTRIAIGVGSATLNFIDDTSDPTYHYVYYTASGNIFRAVYNGTADNYNVLNYDGNKPYQPVQVLKISHAQSWYNFELSDGILYFADAESLGSSSYTYVSAVNLKKDGKLMNNAQIADFNDEYEAAIGEDSYYQELTDDGKSNLATAVQYYFYTGKTQQFEDNIKEAEEETGKKNTLYSEDEVNAFDEYTQKTDLKLRSYFITKLGQMSQADEESYSEYWKNSLQHYTPPTETSTGLPAWAWALIGIAIGLVVIGAGVAVYFVVRSKKKEEEPAKKKMYVDTTDDKDVDVYATDETAPVTEETEETVPEETVPEEPAPEEPAPEEPAPEEPAPEEPAPEQKPEE